MVKKRSQIICIAGAVITLLSGCSSGSSQAAPNYQETKKTVIDILKTDAGKKAVHEIMSDKTSMNQQALNQPAVKDSIVKALTSEKGKAAWSHILSDPSFQKKLAQGMQKEQAALLKKMMNDPDYQQMMMSVLQAPKMQSQYIDLIKTKPYREQLQKVITQTVSSPMFAAQLTDAIQKAVKTQMQKESKKKPQTKSKGSS